jgi:hypothetical protein
LNERFEFYQPGMGRDKHRLRMIGQHYYKFQFPHGFALKVGITAFLSRWFIILFEKTTAEAQSTQSLEPYRPAGML